MTTNQALRVEGRSEDRVRVARALLAWHRGDKDSLDLVLREADKADGGLAGMLFQLIASMEQSLTSKGVRALEQLIAWDLDRDDEEADQ
ncbi:hypothetical protein [Arthrobacter pigmenti]